MKATIALSRSFQKMMPFMSRSSPHRFAFNPESIIFRRRRIEASRPDGYKEAVAFWFPCNVLEDCSSTRLLPLGRLRSRKNETHSLHPLEQTATSIWSRSEEGDSPCVTFRRLESGTSIVVFNKTTPGISRSQDQGRARATQCGSNPRHTPTETKKLMEPRSNHVRPESYDTSTNIPDLHEVGKEQLGVTPRDTKQPSENERLTTGTATSDLHKVKGSQAEPPWTLDTPRGQGTTHSSATMDGTKERTSSAEHLERENWRGNHHRKSAQLACNQDKPSRHKHARHPFRKPPEGPSANQGTNHSQKLGNQNATIGRALEQNHPKSHTPKGATKEKPQTEGKTSFQVGETSL
ncbi:hypothetical protein Taro_044906 [Colocasia esculenta]|uniref:Uncharacterized protein n=1 Tax=Colocasia esculenta TaxID=4460 RepID=A0A843X3Z3_COLES|nr:hypothetical protein [Colocasia esculenta]